MYPVDVYAKVPRTVSLEHPLSSAFAVDDKARASAVTAAIVKVFRMVLCFMRNLLFRLDQSGLPVPIRLTTNKESREWKLQRPGRKA
jgi:hypothetical protein